VLSDNALLPVLRTVLVGFGEWVSQTLDSLSLAKGASHVCEISA
jgi:hypothetical protein